MMGCGCDILALRDGTAAQTEEETVGMNRWQLGRRAMFLAGSALLVLLARPAVQAARPVAEPQRAVFDAERADMQGSSAPSPLDRRMHQLYTRSNHALSRVTGELGTVGLLWLTIAVSIFAFFVVAALASVADRRMFSLRSRGSGELSRYLGH